MTLVGLSVVDNPDVGDTVALRLTVPVKPLTAVTVIVEVPVAPATMVTLVGLADIVKSVTVKVAVAVCTSDPLVPVMVTM